MIEKFVSSFDNTDNRAPNILCSAENGVAVVAIANVSSRNALSLKMWEELESAFRNLAADAAVRVIVLRGAGTEAFAAGADISEFPELRFTASQAAAYNAQLSRTLRQVAEIEIPTIAMLQGFTVGGGCELAAACDLRIAADNLSIGIPVGRLGVILGLTESRLLVRHIGVNGLKRLLFSGELLDAEQAAGMGLVDEVVPAAELTARVSSLAAAVRASSATVMTAAKVITDLAGTLNDAAAERVQELSLLAYDGADLREGVAAFLEKRRPSFASAAAEGERTR